MEQQNENLLRYTPNAVSTLPDIEVVRRAIDGDKDAFAELFQSTYRRMFFVARRILSRDEDIYDALQIAYSKAYRYIGRVSPPEQFYSWLAKIVENSAKDVWRDMHPNEEVLSDEEDRPVPDVTEDSDRRVMVARVLKEMDPRRAEVLALYYYDGLRLTEIAKHLGEPISTIHSRLKAAKRELTDLLAQRGIDRSFYSGGTFSAIAVALRSVVGTDILSAAVAQKMMDEVLSGRPGRLDVAAAKLAEQQRNKAILRIAAILLALVVFVTLLTSALANRWFTRREMPQGEPTAPTTGAYGVLIGGTTTTSASNTSSHATSDGEPTATTGVSGAISDGETTTQENAPTTELGIVTTPTASSSTATTDSSTSGGTTTTTKSPTKSSSATTTTRKPGGTTTMTKSPTKSSSATTTTRKPGGTTTATKSSTKSSSATTTTRKPAGTTTTTKLPTKSPTKSSVTTTTTTTTPKATTTTVPTTPSTDISSKLTYIVMGGKAIITDCDKSVSGAVSIPASLGGVPVDKIASQAFYDCRLITAITLPDAVTEIGAQAFGSCSELRSIVLPDSVTTVGEKAFDGCYLMESIVLGTGVRSFDTFALVGCGSLKSITVRSGNATYHSDGNCLIRTAKKKLVAGSLNSVIPDDGSVTTIGEAAFQWLDGGIQTLTIPDSITYIEQMAFSNVKNLYITDLEAWCGITFEDDGANPMRYAQNIYINGEKVTGKLVVPRGVTTIKQYAFAGCTMAQIELLEGVSTIESQAFAFCKNLIAVSLPKSLRSIDQNTFHLSPKITNVSYAGSESDRSAITGLADCEQLTSATWDYNN